MCYAGIKINNTKLLGEIPISLLQTADNVRLERPVVPTYFAQGTGSTSVTVTMPSHVLPSQGRFTIAQAPATPVTVTMLSRVAAHVESKVGKFSTKLVLVRSFSATIPSESGRPQHEELGLYDSVVSLPSLCPRAVCNHSVPMRGMCILYAEAAEDEVDERSLSHQST